MSDQTIDQLGAVFAPSNHEMPASPPVAATETPPLPTETPTPNGSEARPGNSTNGRGKRRVHSWLRFAHVYTSMISLLIVLFFGITGITLNHPSWTFGDETTISTYAGTLPENAASTDEAEFLLASEYVRTEYNVGGEVADFSLADGEGSITYKGPGYGADLFFDTETGDYSLTVQEQGWVGVMNDLHKGRDTSTLWRWVIDLSAGLLVAVALTGLGVQFFLRKRRFSALTWSAIGATVSVILIWLAMV